jgi:hypothetical protein
MHVAYLAKTGNSIDNALVDMLNNTIGEERLKYAKEKNEKLTKKYEFPYTIEEGTSSYAIQYENKVRVFVNGNVEDVIN